MNAAERHPQRFLLPAATRVSAYPSAAPTSFPQLVSKKKPCNMSVNNNSNTLPNKAHLDSVQVEVQVGRYIAGFVSSSSHR